MPSFQAGHRPTGAHLGNGSRSRSREQQHVLRLEVTVHQAVLVQVPHARCHLQRSNQRLQLVCVGAS
jgi:hypothetical protein